MVSGIRSSLKRALASALVVSFLASPLSMPREAAADTYVTDGASHPPPSAGAYAYYSTFGVFGPDQSGFPGVGQSFVDPVFGSTIRRLTNEMGQHSQSEIYSKNGYFNADGTLVHHRAPGGHTIIDTTTGQVVRTNVPGNYDSSFAPADPDAWYWFAFGGTTLNKYSVATGTSTVVKTFAGALGQLGGSVDWIDRSGRYMVLNIAGATRVWDRQTDTLYAGSIPGSYGGGGGWVGISPDGNYVITSTPPTSSHSWRIDHATQTVSTSPVLFWTLCGGHGDLVSASNGTTYFVSFDCHTTGSVYRADVSLPQSAGNVPKQLSDNMKLFQLASWSDVDGHFSGVSKGPLQDWVFASIESGDDGFTSGLGSWRPYEQEIVMANVLTGEVRRLAHHRSRGLSQSYYGQPRVSTSWDGSVVLWTSNFGYSVSGYADLYGMTIGAPSSPLAVTFTAPAAGATVSGTSTVTMAATGGSGTGYTYTLEVDGTTVSTGGESYAWNTSGVANGTHTLRATVTDSAGGTATTTQSLTVENVVPLTTSFTNPASGAAVSGNVTVSAGASGGSGTGYSYTVKAGATTIYAGTGNTFTWNTTTVANGSQTLSVTTTDSASATASASSTVTVQNVTPVVASFGSPASGATVAGSVTVSVSASGGTGSGYTYVVKAGASTIYTGPYASSSWNTTTTPNGPVTLTVTATDPAGGTGTTTRNVTVSNVTADTTPPTVSITSPAGNVWTGNSINIAATAADNAALSKIELWGNGAPFKTVTCAGTSCSTGAVQWITGPLTGKAYQVHAVAIDAAGNKTLSAPRIIYKNGTSPVIPSGASGGTPPPPPPVPPLTAAFTSPTSGATVSGTITATLSIGGASGATTVSVSLDGAPVGSATVSGTTASYTVNTTTVPNGSHTVSAVVTDGLGRTANASVTVTVSNTAPTGDTTLPAVSITSPGNNVWTGNSINVSVTATDNVAVKTIEVYGNGSKFATVSCSGTSCSGTVLWLTGGLPAGKHTITAVATDSSGNKKTSAAVTINK